jgi:hypothetical protein
LRACIIKLHSQMTRGVALRNVIAIEIETFLAAP